jgi:hypothetical protein
MEEDYESVLLIVRECFGKQVASRYRCRKKKLNNCTLQYTKSLLERQLEVIGK